MCFFLLVQAYQVVAPWSHTSALQAKGFQDFLGKYIKVYIAGVENTDQQSAE